MKAVGITVEYNPFHNGHLHHVQQARKRSEADVVVAVMSGNFVQRGEPALVDKWARTQMALDNGVDIVIELPYVFSTAYAPNFAKGAITLLDAMCCDAFAFGNESGQATDFQQTVQLLQQHQSRYDEIIQQAVKTGMSYPRAMAQAFTMIAPQARIDLTQPNNILGFHYVKSAIALGSTMQAITIPRIAANYHDDLLNHTSIASATAIRQALLTSTSITNVVPPITAQLLSQTKQVTWEDYYPLLRHTLLQWSPAVIATFADVAEGIEHTLKKAAIQAITYSQFLNRIKSKRYTTARLQRMLTHILVGITQQQRDNLTTPRYIRLLGMTTTGQRYLKHTKKTRKLPVVSRVAGYQDDMLAIDCKATQIYTMISGSPLTDFSVPPIIKAPST